MITFSAQFRCFTALVDTKVKCGEEEWWMKRKASGRCDNFKFKLRGHMTVHSHGHCPQPGSSYYRARRLVSLLLEKETKGFRSPSPRVFVLYFLFAIPTSVSLQTKCKTNTSYFILLLARSDISTKKYASGRFETAEIPAPELP